jgi:hypothetical protein
VDYWPLLDIREALADCARTVAELVSLVETLQAETDDGYPPDAAHLLATFGQLEALLAGAITPALAEAMAAEHAAYDADMARWEGRQP